MARTLAQVDAALATAEADIATLKQAGNNLRNRVSAIEDVMPSIETRLQAAEAAETNLTAKLINLTAAGQSLAERVVDVEDVADKARVILRRIKADIALARTLLPDKDGGIASRIEKVMVNGRLVVRARKPR